MKNISLFLFISFLAAFTLYSTGASLYKQKIDWGVNHTNAPVAWGNEYTGKGVKIAILDTGVGPHSDLVVSGGASFVGGTYNDKNGHGTHLAGIIGAKRNKIGTVGVAPDSSIYAAKISPTIGVVQASDIIQGIDWGIENKMDIIVINPSLLENNTSLEEACNRAYNAGILLVSGAGNTGKSHVLYPAAYPSVISVGSLTKENKHFPSSSYGFALDIVAPGQSIYAPYKNNTYASLSDSSVASAHVAGILALLKEKYPTYTNTQLRTILQENAIDLGKKGRDIFYGYGLAVFK